MSFYLVKTHEQVTGEYLVKAGSVQEAEGKMRQPFTWDDVEQTSYEAFMVEVESIEEVAVPADDA